MRSLLILLTSILLALGGGTALADTRADVGFSLTNGNLRSFHLAIGEYYRIPEREVIIIRERRIPEYEIPVVLFIAERARVAPAAIIDLRLAGRSWLDISLRYGIGPEVYYVPVERDHGPPYGKAYGHYKHKHKWKEVRLDDDDVVNLVNLRFLSERYRYEPEHIVRMRSEGHSFAAINDEIRHYRKGRKHKDEGDD